jgi:hypothetical protein
MSEWHACRLPLFRKVTLIEPKFILYDWIVRRRLNNVWQYRAMTDQEYSDHIKKNEPTKVIVASEKSSRSAKLGHIPQKVSRRGLNEAAAAAVKRRSR